MLFFDVGKMGRYLYHFPPPFKGGKMVQLYRKKAIIVGVAMTILETARSWISKGFSVIPVRYRDKRPDIRLLPGRQWGIFQTRLPLDTELLSWFPSRLHNLAIITGWNNLVVVDFDNQDVFDCWWHLFPIRTYMVKTARGMHVYLKVNRMPANYHGDFIDVKAKGGYVLIPPSIHPSGFEYQVFLDLPIMEVEKLNVVVPDDLLSVRETPVNVFIPPPAISLPDDLWESVEHVTDEDLVKKVRKKNLLDFFPGAIRTSNDNRWWIARCPFHDDHNPSFWIDTTRQICGCYAGCTPKPLDVINLYARLYGLTNRDAIFALAKMI
jgi:hypothetical protein